MAIVGNGGGRGIDPLTGDVDEMVIVGKGGGIGNLLGGDEGEMVVECKEGGRGLDPLGGDAGEMVIVGNGGGFVWKYENC